MHFIRACDLDIYEANGGLVVNINVSKNCNVKAVTYNCNVKAVMYNCNVKAITYAERLAVTGS